MYSIYHFFKSLVNHKHGFANISSLEIFPFDDSMISFRSQSRFPDLAIRVNRDRSRLTGGELIELKDSRSYSVSSFNSTIPTAQKDIRMVIRSAVSSLRPQIEAAQDWDFIEEFPVRDVFYLIRGRYQDHIKVCLTQGSFFETIQVETLIQNAFSQVIDEQISELPDGVDSNRSDELKRLFSALFKQQHIFSRVRCVDQASINIRFRVMTEAKTKANLLNSKFYPQIQDNTLNLVVSCHDKVMELQHLENMRLTFSRSQLDDFRYFKMKHHFNGYFLVFQTTL